MLSFYTLLLSLFEVSEAIVLVDITGTYAPPNLPLSTFILSIAALLFFEGFDYYYEG